jgi:hypothetical protein
MAWVRENSFEIELVCHDQAATVRVTRDGILEMDGYNPQHEQALMEFCGVDPSPCFEAYRRWDDAPAKIILTHFSLTYFSMCRLVLDWAEHVSWMIFDRTSSLTNQRTHRMFDEARELVDIREDLHSGTTMSPKKASRGITIENNLRFFISHLQVDLTHPAHPASRHALDAAGAGINVARTSDYFFDSAQARFFVIENGSDAVNFAARACESKHRGGARREQNWQVRRFIDVMSALKHKQPWPPLKWTK